MKTSNQQKREYISMILLLASIITIGLSAGYVAAFGVFLMFVSYHLQFDWD